MINSIETKNYHSHKNTKIIFDSGVNIIAGNSDAGKSDILRQAKWVFANRPMGDSIKSWGMDKEDETNVCLTMPEGVCSKKRIGSKAIYELEINSQKTTLEAVKTDVPIEIQDLFNLSEFNFQGQHSGYLLLNDSPGEVAKKLNDLVGLGIIDTMFRNLASKALENKRKSEEEIKRAEFLTIEIDKLSYLDIINTKLQSIKLLIDKYNNDIINQARLSNLINDYEITNDKIKKFSPILKLVGQHKDLQKQIQCFQTLQERYSRISGITTKIIVCQSIIKKDFPLLSMEINAKDLQKQIQFVKEKQIKLDRLRNFVKTITDIQTKIESEKEWLLVDIPYREIKELTIDYQSKKNDYLKLKKIIVGCKLAENTTKEVNELNMLVEKKKKFLVENKICPLCKTVLTSDIIKGMM